MAPDYAISLITVKRKKRWMKADDEQVRPNWLKKQAFPQHTKMVMTICTSDNKVFVN